MCQTFKSRETPVVGLEVDHGEGQCGTGARYIYIYRVTLLESNCLHIKKLLLSYYEHVNIFICLVLYESKNIYLLNRRDKLQDK